jgi:hypothetical protein
MRLERCSYGVDVPGADDALAAVRIGGRGPVVKTVTSSNVAMSTPRRNFFMITSLCTT